MHEFGHLETDNVYLIREKEDKEITLVEVMMETEKCVFVLCHCETEITFWRKKTDKIFEIIEQLTEDQITQYEEIINEGYNSASWYEDN